VMQSLLGGAAFATMMVVVFLCLPIWKQIWDFTLLWPQFALYITCVWICWDEICIDVIVRLWDCEIVRLWWTIIVGLCVATKGRPAKAKCPTRQMVK
jgi:hypothetical protein